MKCREVKNNLVDFATGKIRSEEIEKHLAECESCRAEYIGITEVVPILKDYKFEEPSEFYWANFLPRVKKKISERAGSGFVFSLKPVLLAPSLAVLIIGFLFGILFSNLQLKQEDFYVASVFETSGVFVKPAEFSDVNSETLERAISYLYEKYQIPEFEGENYNYQDIDIEEVLNRISNKF